MREAGEIASESAEQSATKDNNEDYCGAGLAIDMDLDTNSYAASSFYSTIWFKMNLGQVHCIHQVKNNVNLKLYGSNPAETYRYMWTCTMVECRERSSTSNIFTLTVSTEATETSNLPSVSDCKYGKTVKLEKNSYPYELNVNEMWIIGKQGRFGGCIPHIM